MPSSSSHRSGSRSSGSTNEEPKRRKRYSLRIEFLDDDDDIELDRSRDTAHQQRRSDQRAPLSQKTSNGRPEGSQNTSQRSRRSSVSSTTAIVGTGNRGGPPAAAARLPSVRGRHGETRPHATHTTQHENHAPAVDQLTRDFTRQMTVKDPSDADLTQRFQQQMSLGNPTNKPPRRKHTSTQTDLRGLGWSTLNLSTRPPTPIPAFTHPPTQHPPSREHISIEAAYREGFKAGKRSASAQPRTSGGSSPLIPPASATATRPWPQISPPRPVSQHRSFEVPTARARDGRRASSHSGARGGERRREQPQPQPQHSWVKAFLRRGRET